MRAACAASHAARTSLAMVWLGLILALLGGALAAPGQTPRSAVLLEIEGAIGPATADYIDRGLSTAAEEQAPLVIIRMDTPGGLDTSMRKVILEILASPVPVTTFVAPSGARAASAGTYILYASHFAAMAPGTNVGAATPVQIGGSPPPSSPADRDEQAKDDQAKPDRPANPSEAKAVNDAVAYIRSLAELRGRNADWAEAAVRTADSLSAGAALKRDVIDVVARDVPDLLGQLHGRTVTAAGIERTLDTRNLAVTKVEPNWRTRLLGAIANPNVALILMMIGIYGLIFEFMNPGALYPGTIGAICLLIGLYALAALPVNAAGIALILLGVALMAGEAITPSFGVLGLGGAVALVVGATILIDTDVPQFQVSWPVLAGLAALSVGMAVLIARLAVTAHRRKVVSGREELIGLVGTVIDWDRDQGHVFVHSERWRATGVGQLQAGDRVRVVAVAVEGLTLKVEPDRPQPHPQSDPAPPMEG